MKPVKWKCGCVYDHHKDPYYFPCGKDDCEITKGLKNVKNNPIYVSEVIVYGEK